MRSIIYTICWTGYKVPPDTIWHDIWESHEDSYKVLHPSFLWVWKKNRIIAAVHTTIYQNKYSTGLFWEVTLMENKLGRFIFIEIFAYWLSRTGFENATDKCNKHGLLARGLKNNCVAQSLVPCTVCHRSAHNEADNVLTEIHQDHCFLKKERNCKMAKVSVYNLHIINVEWRIPMCYIGRWQTIQ